MPWKSFWDVLLVFYEKEKTLRTVHHFTAHNCWVPPVLVLPPQPVVPHHLQHNRLRSQRATSGGAGVAKRRMAVPAYQRVVGEVYNLCGGL